MAPITSVPSVLSSLPLKPADPATVKVRIAAPLDGAAPAQQAQGFGSMLEGLVHSVDGKQTQAQELTRRVLLGESDQLHQSVIAMQEAGVAFGLMVEVRNKLVESYQELMRMQV